MKKTELLKQANKAFKLSQKSNKEDRFYPIFWAIKNINLRKINDYEIVWSNNCGCYYPRKYDQGG